LPPAFSFISKCRGSASYRITEPTKEHKKMGAPGGFAAPVASPSSPQSTATGVMDDDSTHQRDVLPLALVGIVRAMMRQEEDVYAYHRYRPGGCQTTSIKEKWRQDICHWVSSVKELLACQSFGTSWTENLTTVTLFCLAT